jgi:hypothetical protein
MPRIRPILACALLAAIGLLRSEVGPAAAGPRRGMHAALVESAATVCNAPDGCAVSDFQRDPILPGIVHYSAILQTGPGPFDRIRIHRVVKERRPGRAANDTSRIFLIHGDWKDFVGCFLPAVHSPSTSPDFGFAVYLASRNVDVWGLDQAWTLVPEETTDFGFMAGWGLQRQVDDARTALAVARWTRLLLGDGHDRFNLLGYSSGGMTGYALLDFETQLPRSDRHVQGFIAGDIPYKSLDGDFRDAFCAFENYYRSFYDQGIYQEDALFRPMGRLARNDPDGASPILPGFTNLQAALFLGAGPLFGATPIHYIAGEFDENGMPTGLQYIRTEAWLDFMESGVPYEPWRFEIDYSEVLCGVTESPFDDHLAEIAVPVFNWGAAGGFAPYGADTLALLGSRDTTSLVIGLHPPEEILLEFAHIDLFLGVDAPTIAWAPIADWLRAHP